MTLREEVEQLLRDALKDNPLVLEVEVFGREQAIDAHDIESTVGVHTAWLGGITVALYRIAEQIDQSGGA